MDITSTTSQLQFKPSSFLKDNKDDYSAIMAKIIQESQKALDQSAQLNG